MYVTQKERVKKRKKRRGRGRGGKEKISKTNSIKNYLKYKLHPIIYVINKRNQNFSQKKKMERECKFHIFTARIWDSMCSVVLQELIFHSSPSKSKA